MTLSEQVFKLDTEIQKISKALCASGLIKQHIQHSQIYIPERHSSFINECISVISFSESQMHEELGERLCTILGCSVIDDDVINAFLPQHSSQDEEVVSSD